MSVEEKYLNEREYKMGDLRGRMCPTCVSYEASDKPIKHPKFDTHFSGWCRNKKSIFYNETVDFSIFCEKYKENKER